MITCAWKEMIFFRENLEIKLQCVNLDVVNHSIQYFTPSCGLVAPSFMISFLRAFTPPHFPSVFIRSQPYRTRFVFKVIPMLNPDGVVNGNYRTSLAGCDLNRKWSNPDPTRHPTIYHTKELIRRLKHFRTVGLVLDLHGHSRRQVRYVVEGYCDGTVTV